jgi:hypothetical protein
LQLDKDIAAFLEFETEQIHIMPLRPINDPRRFMSASQATG